MKEELEYSQNGVLNVDLFFSNDINFYIEDKGKEYRYESILKELFDIKIEKIFALDGKNNLKNKFNELKNNKNLDNNFFIADLDFDYLLEKDIIVDEHFIYLEKYEIENYIIDEKAIIHYLKNELCCLEDEARKLLNYKQWLKDTYKDLYKLFILYFIVQKENIELVNTYENPNQYFDEEGKVIYKKIENYYNRLKKCLRDIDKNIDIEFVNCDTKVQNMYNKDFSKFIKGKYLLVGIRKILSNTLTENLKKTRKVNEKHLTDCLFDFFDKKSIMFIKKKVENCLQSNK